MTLLAELQRRNVFRMAGLYLVGAWLVVQVASTVLPLFGAPAWVPRSIVIVLALGLLPALVFSWVFELTPEGLKRDGEASPAQSLAPQTAHRLNRMIIVALALALGYFALDKFGLAPRREAAVLARAERAEAEASRPKPLTQEHSIAVLPFVNLSSDPEQAYFSDGLSEDLIAALSQFGGLKVISRNSSFRFRDSKDDSRSIGAQLGVAHLLAGSVRRAGGVVRINADLVSVSDGRTLWSQHFDRPYTDLFKLQDEITRAVASELKARLLTKAGAVTQSDHPPSGSLAAYNAFLQGQSQAARSGHEGFQKAIGYFQEAVRLDPRYARAHAALAMALTVDAAVFLSGEAARAAHARALRAVDTALALAPQMAWAHIARGQRLLGGALDWRGAAAEFRLALKLAPNESAGMFGLAQALGALGQVDEAIALLRQAIELDPLDAGRYYWLSIMETGRGNLAEAERLIDKALEMQPDAAQGSAQKVGLQALAGRYAGAVATATRMPPGTWRDVSLAYATQRAGDRAAADAALAQLIARHSQGAGYQIAQVYALRQQPDEMFRWLDRAWSSRDPGIRRTLLDPFLAPYRGDPRFAAFCRKVGLPPPEAAPGA